MTLDTCIKTEQIEQKLKANTEIKSPEQSAALIWEKWNICVKIRKEILTQSRTIFH
jgi:hypothetical protein